MGVLTKVNIYNNYNHRWYVEIFLKKLRVYINIQLVFKTYLYKNFIVYSFEKISDGNETNIYNIGKHQNWFIIS